MSVSRKVTNYAILSLMLPACQWIPGMNYKSDDCEDVGYADAHLDAVRPGWEAKVMPPPPPLTPTIETYATCSAMQDDLRGDWQSRRNYYPAPGTPIDDLNVIRPSCNTRSAARKAMPASGAVAPEVADDAISPAKSFTNTQEKNVDEADSVKIGDHHIYVARAGGIQVIARQSLALIGVLPQAAAPNTTLYADGDTLVVTSWDNGATTVRIFAAADGQLPELKKQHDLTGYPADSRYVNGHLVLIFQDMLPWNGYSEDPSQAPILVESDAVKGIPCDRIIKPAAHDYDTRFTKIVSLDARTPDAAPQFTAAIGGGDHIYMTESSLYLAKTAEQLVITKLALDAATGAVTPVAAGLIDGHVKDQWAFNEYPVDGAEPVLAVATSTGYLRGTGVNTAQNHLWVLRAHEANFEVAAAIHDFGTGEDIRSVRYVNDMAYVVTFKKTDPLFAFAMANPLEPKLLGELKVPGFSVYMHPVASGRMLGVGFDADDQGDFAWYQGLQVSLFDVSDPLNLSRLDNKILGQRGSYSDVTGDHHAFYFDADKKIVGIPAVLLGGKGEDTGPTMANTLEFSGAIVYRVDDAQLTEAARLSHADLLPEACKVQLRNGHWWQDKAVSMDINRLYSVDGKLLTVSRFGLKTWDFAHLDQPAVATVAFAVGAEDCGYIYGQDM